MKNLMCGRATLSFVLCFSLLPFLGCQTDDASNVQDLGAPGGISPDSVPGVSVSQNAPDVRQVDERVPRGIEQLTAEENQYNSMNPHLARGLGGATYLVWERCRLGDSCEKQTVMAARHDGSAWGTPVEISRLAEGSGHATSPAIAVDSSGVAHLVWKDSGRIGARPIDSDFIYRTWNGDGEAGLGEPQTVSVGVNLDCDEFSDCARVHDAAVALSGDVPTVAFSAGGTARKFEVFYATATNGSWSAAQVSDGSFDVPAYAGIGAHSPDMATDFLGNTYLVWVNQITETNSELQFRSVGDSLGRLNRIENDCSTNRVFNPSVAVDEAGAGHLVWAAPSGCGGPSTVSNIYYTTIEGDGVVQAAAVVSSDEGLQGVQNASPEVMVTDRDGESVVAVVWTSSATINGSGTDYDILMKTFGESGDSIPSRVVSEPDSMVNVSAYASYSPTLVSGDAGTLVCWQEKDGNEMADFDVSCTGMGW